MNNRQRISFDKVVSGKALESMIIESARVLRLNLEIGDEFGDFEMPDKTYMHTNVILSTDARKHPPILLARTAFNINEEYSHLAFECEGPKHFVRQYFDELLKRVRNYK